MFFSLYVLFFYFNVCLNKYKSKFQNNASKKFIFLRFGLGNGAKDP